MNSVFLYCMFTFLTESLTKVVILILFKCHSLLILFQYLSDFLENDFHSGVSFLYR